MVDPTYSTSKPKRTRGWRYDPHRWDADIAAREAARIVEMDAIPASEGLCYFIGSDEESGALGIVKIGWSINVARRFAQIRAISGPIRVRLLATARGGRTREAYYHQRFAEHALGGEWFARVPEIEAEIAYLERTKVAA